MAGRTSAAWRQLRLDLGSGITSSWPGSVQASPAKTWNSNESTNSGNLAVKSQLVPAFALLGAVEFSRLRACCARFDGRQLDRAATRRWRRFSIRSCARRRESRREMRRRIRPADRSRRESFCAVVGDDRAVDLQLVDLRAGRIVLRAHRQAIEKRGRIARLPKHGRQHQQPASRSRPRRGERTARPKNLPANCSRG